MTEDKRVGGIEFVLS